MKKKNNFLTIGEVAKKLGILPSQVRYYTNLGLIKESGRTQGEYRLYEKKVISEIEEILKLKKEGRSLSEIKSMIFKKPGLEEIFSQYPVRFAYLFGSKVTGKSGPLSDIDLAVFLDLNLDKDKRFQIRIELISRLSSAYKKEVDLIVLNDTFNLLAYNIIFEGKVIYNIDEAQRVKFEAKVMSLYFDQQYYYKKRALSTIDKIAREGIL
ncbi:MAG: MerR family transcriptional regulator [Candidatus Omnitrophica bacterium]|nr:MerR family transcriptional regulator [Candidatus Omnitrophota bacterium]